MNNSSLSVSSVFVLRLWKKVMIGKPLPLYRVTNLWVAISTQNYRKLALRYWREFFAFLDTSTQRKLLRCR